MSTMPPSPRHLFHRLRSRAHAAASATGAAAAAADAQLKKKRLSSGGVLSLSASRSSTTGREMPQFCCRWMPLPTCSRTAATTRGWQWPVEATPMPVWKSRYRRPRTSVTQLPDAESTTMLLPLGARGTAGLKWRSSTPA